MTLTPNDLYLFQVTSDIHIIQSTSLQIVNTIFSFGGIVRCLFGPLGFKTTFVWVKMMEWAVGFFLGVTNVSAFMQVALIIDFR